MTPAHVATFKKLDVSALPDVHGLVDEAHQILWALSACKSDAILEWISAGELSDILRDCARIDIPRQRVSAILEQEKKQGAVARQRRHGKWNYTIMRPGEQKLSASLIAPLFIDPARAFSATRKLTDIFGDLRGHIRYCDPYIASRTLDFLAECKQALHIKLLTVNVQGSTSFKADLTAFNREHNGKLKVGVIGQGHLHDRYLVHDDGILLMGASVKDVGKKQSFVIAAGKDIAGAVAPAFDKLWTQSAPI